MAAPITVHCNGSRYTAKVGPMAPLSQVVESVCQQVKPAADPAGCQLLLNKKPLDLSTPVRFANIPRDAKLELKTGAVRRLGVQTQPSGPANAAEHTVAQPAAVPAQHQPSTSQQQAPAQAQAVPQASHASAPPQAHAAAAAAHRAADAEPSSQHAQHAQHAQPAGYPVSLATAHALEQIPLQIPSQAQGPAPIPAPGPAPVTATDTQPSSSTVPSSQQPPPQPTASTSQPPASAAAAPQADPLGLGRGVHVFTREATMAAEAASRGNMDLPPDFYDFTPDDYHTTMAGYAAKRAREESGLRTAKLREAEERQKAAALGPVPVRVHFPNGIIVQASFQALETVAALHQLVERCIPATKAKWYLYTTPPKQPLKDTTVTLYRAGLVPAANVYFGCDNRSLSEPYLRPDVLGLLSEPPKRAEHAAGTQKQEGRAVAGEGSRGGDAGFRPPSVASGDAAKKMPKWMKLGK